MGFTEGNVYANNCEAKTGPVIFDEYQERDLGSKPWDLKVLEKVFVISFELDSLYTVLWSTGIVCFQWCTSQRHCWDNDGMKETFIESLQQGFNEFHCLVSAVTVLKIETFFKYHRDSGRFSVAINISGSSYWNIHFLLRNSRSCISINCCWWCLSSI